MSMSHLFSRARSEKMVSAFANFIVTPANTLLRAGALRTPICFPSQPVQVGATSRRVQHNATMSMSTGAAVKYGGILTVALFGILTYNYIHTSSVPSKYVMVYSTTPSQVVADKLAAGIVEKKLAACVQRIPGVTSTYWWEGKVETGQEHLLSMKTTRELYPKLEQFITLHHPYDTPEIVATDITGGLPKYLQWIDQSTLQKEDAAK